MYVLLAIGARRFGDTVQMDVQFRTRIWRILAAAAIMGVVLWVFNVQLTTLLNVPWWRGLGLLILIVVAAVSYFGGGQALGAFRLQDFRAAVRRKG